MKKQKTITLINRYRESLATIRDWHYNYQPSITTPEKYCIHRAFCLDMLTHLRAHPELNTSEAR